jgi:ELWxxDGT repeat protein
VAFSSKLFFAAYDATNSNWTMWSSDGTVAGTTQFLTAASQPVYVTTTPDFTIVGSELFGEYIQVGGGNVLGKTDGTAGGTVIVQLGTSGTVASNPSNMADDNGFLVFNAFDSAHGLELWQSDGTSAGTLLSADINPGTANGNPIYMTTVGSQVYFNANDGVHGQELWTATIAADVVTAGISGPTDGVTEQHRDFVITGNDSNSGNNSAGFSFAIDWGDGNTETITGQSGLTADHQYATTANYTIKVTATNLADNVTSIAASLIDNITATELQGGDLAVGGLSGNNTWVITKGTGSSFTVTDNTKTMLHNFTPATGEQILLFSGNGTNTITINDSGTSKDSFTLGGGYVIFNRGTFVAMTPATWTVNGNNSTSGNTYTIVGAASASINGGTGPNTFNVSTGGSLSGTLSGGSDTSKNLLSYAKYATSGVVVDLPLESATAIDGGTNGGISGIENVTGSSVGGDILVGDANANTLTTIKGHNILIGGSGGGDTLTSGAKGMDILIAGTTNYDSNIAALQTIMATWKTSTASNYSTVISTIMGNSFADPLNTTTVSDSGASDAADTLNGSGKATTDWFFLHNTGGSPPNDNTTGVGTGDTQTSI